MKNFKRCSIFLLLIICLFTTVSCAKPKFPTPTSDKYVNDYTGTLSNDTKEKIIALGKELYEKTTAEVAVVVIDTTDDMSIDDYANDLIEKWGIGTKGKDNGVLLLVAVKDRNMKIEPGYGLEGILTDGKTGEISDKFIVPFFKQDDYDSGTLNGYNQICKEVAKEYNVSLEQDFNKTPSNYNKNQINYQSNSSSGLVLLFVIFALLDGFVFRGKLLRTLMFIFFSGNGPRRGGRGGFGGGGFGGGSSSGGSSSNGGFGGGSSGGGGSSRSW